MSVTAQVLIVDDEAVVRLTVRRAVERLGFEAVEAEDGVSAARRLEEGGIDLVVSDIAMPGMDGVELLRMVESRDLDVPVILITGAPSLESAIEAVQHGAFAYLTKPFALADLTKEVTRAIHLRRMALIKERALALSGLHAGRVASLKALGAGFDRALSSLWMAFQPIVSAQDSHVQGYEALLRSDEPSLSHPSAMLDAAERLGRLQDLGRMVRSRSVPPMEDAPDRGLLFVNIHPLELMDQDLVAPSVPLSRLADRVVVEVTERAPLRELATARRRVDQLRELGFRIAVDDLGAGYAGLTSFANLSPDFVKIDMSLVRGVDRDPLRQKLIRSVTDLCGDMGITVVAEGIEVEEERAAVVDLGCDLLQGFLFGRPAKLLPAPAS